MIYDVFNFFDELELLEIRLHELDDFVDVFVLVEGTKNHQNRPKPLYYEENKVRFAEFHHKIRHVIMDDSPDTTVPHVIEKYEFNEGGNRGMHDIGVDDHVLWCCVDEIPNKAAIRSAMRYVDYPQIMMMIPLGGFLNCRLPDGWPGGRLLTGRMWRQSGNQYDDFRLGSISNSIPDAGWHFWNMGGAERLRLKWQSFGHSELNTPEWLATCEARVRDFYELAGGCSLAPLDLLPSYIAANKERFAHMLIPERT
jgi:beta-1,4-mannosyl-glycoprotein beta-1,4-N-acetylglucosaminyltransferase